MIKMENGKRRYFDRNGSEITAGCQIRYESGQIRTVYLTEDNQLGTDATNPRWIATGRAISCEYGIYPLSKEETEEVTVI